MSDTGMAGDERRLLRIPELKAEKMAFESTIIGQEEAVEAFSVMTAKIRSGVRAGKGPIDVKFLVGPSGVGKTEIVKQLAEVLGGDPSARSKIIRIDAQEYSHGHEVAKLTGPPPGYRGSGDPRTGEEGVPILFSQKNVESNTIHYKDKNGEDKSVVIILVDEAEKGAPELHKLFLGVMDEGRVQLGDNSTTDLTNAVIFFTSNVGNDAVEEARKGLTEEEADSPGFKEKAKTITLNALSSAFPPEFRGRIQEMIQFNSLKPEQLERIAGLMLQQTEEAMWESVGIDLEIQMSPQAMVWIRSQGYNPSEGARALGKVIKRFIDDPIALLHTDSDLDKKTLYVDLNAEGDGVEFFDVPINEARIFRTPRPMVQASHQGLSEYEDKPDQSRTGRSSLPRPSTTSYKPMSQVQNPAPPAVEQELSSSRQLMDPLRSALRQGPDAYSMALREAIRNGSPITREMAGEDPRILEIARGEILHGHRGYTYERVDEMVRAGIGTKEYWNDVLKEEAQRVKDEKDAEKARKKQLRAENPNFWDRLANRIKGK